MTLNPVTGIRRKNPQDRQAHVHEKQPLDNLANRGRDAPGRLQRTSSKCCVTGDPSVRRSDSVKVWLTRTEI